MINRLNMMEAARYNDAQLAELGDDLHEWGKVNGIDLVGLAYVAEQRAIRMAMVDEGRDPTRLSQTHYSTVTLSAASQARIVTFASCWFDGFAAGVRAARGEQR